MILLLPAIAARCVPLATAVTMTLLGAPAKPSLEVSQTRIIPASPAAVWAVVGGFCDIRRWHGQVRSCAQIHVEGQTVRSINLRGIGTLVEVQLDRDEDTMTYSYALMHSPWPLKRHRAILSVFPDGNGSVVTWRATFRLENAWDDGAVSQIEDLFRSGLADIAHEVAR